jgi:phage-related protein
VPVKRKTAAGVEAVRLSVKEKQGKRVPAIFFRTEAGGEPLREWLKGTLSLEDQNRIGEELRSHLARNRIARVLFYLDTKGRMVLLHGFVKKTQKTPLDDLELARENKRKHEKGLT